MSSEDDKAPDRQLTSIEVTRDAIAGVDQYLSRRGGRGIKKLAMSRLFEWFAALPDSAKSAVLGWVDDDLRAASARVLRQLADEVETGVAHDPRNQGFSVIRPPEPSRPAADGKPKSSPQKSAQR